MLIFVVEKLGEDCFFYVVVCLFVVCFDEWGEIGVCDFEMIVGYEMRYLLCLEIEKLII